MTRFLVTLFALIALTGIARSESLVLGLSSDDFRITSSFAGGEITIFGTVLGAQGTIARRGAYGVAIVVRGPRADIVTRKKSRVLGIWVNRTAEIFPGVPSYYAMLSSRPLSELGEPTLLTQLSVGTPYLDFQPQDSNEEFSDKIFRDAMIRLKKAGGLYYDLPEAVTFLAPSLFSATIPLPENVTVGAYTGEAYLFQDGVLLETQPFSFKIQKEGFEQLMYDLAHDYSFLYGLGAVFMAFFTGWAAGVIFRKD